MTKREKCGGTNYKGLPCQSYSLKESDPPRCAYHFDSREQVAVKVKCSAMTTRKLPCQLTALRGTEPPLCYVHAGMTAEDLARGKGAHVRCGSTRNDGLQCMAVAVANTEPPTCAYHAGLTGLQPPKPKQQMGVRRMLSLCTATAPSTGKVCGNIALAGTDPPKCHVHQWAEKRVAPEKPRCASLGRSGERCRKFALKGSDPPLCTHHITRPVMPVRIGPAGEENGDEVEAGLEEPKRDLMEEMNALRLTLRRVLELQEGEMSTAEFARMAEVTIRAATAISNLMKAGRDMGMFDPLQEEIGLALDELSKEWGIPL